MPIASTSIASSPLPATPSASGDAFLKDNYLSTDIRVPITLVGTNSGRAVAHQRHARDRCGTTSRPKTTRICRRSAPCTSTTPTLGNEARRKPSTSGATTIPTRRRLAGPGYYRPASLISLWATAPYLHNNALGALHARPVGGGPACWRSTTASTRFSGRRSASRASTDAPGRSALRGTGTCAAATPASSIAPRAVSWIDIPARFVRPLLVGVLGRFLDVVPDALPVADPGGRSLVLLVFVGRDAPRRASCLRLSPCSRPSCLRISGIDSIYPRSVAGPGHRRRSRPLVLWLGPQKRVDRPDCLCATGPAVSSSQAARRRAFVDGKLGPLKVGPIPKGTPVNLIMNINPEAPPGVLIEAAFGDDSRLPAHPEGRLADTTARR